MPFSLQHKCLFIHIPRTGGISFTRSLGMGAPNKISIAQDLNGDFELRPKDETQIPLSVQLHHLCMKHVQLLGVLNHSLLTESFKCAFIRNPWDKSVSEYSHYYHKYCTDFEDYVHRLEKIVSFVNENFVFDFNNIFYKEYSDLMISTFGLAPTWKGEVFEQSYIKDHPFAKELTWVDPHFFPQYFFIYDEFGNNLMDFIGRFENYREDAQKILDHLEVGQLIHHLNSSKHLNYREVYNLKTKDVIFNLFKEDIQRFDYTF